MLEVSGIDPGDLPSPFVDFFIHVRRATGAVSPTTVPETDELNFSNAIRQGRIKEPEIAPLEWIDPLRG